jgi:hypothetical protein
VEEAGVARSVFTQPALYEIGAANTVFAGVQCGCHRRVQHTKISTTQMNLKNISQHGH